MLLYFISPTSFQKLMAYQMIHNVLECHPCHQISFQNLQNEQRKLMQWRDTIIVLKLSVSKDAISIKKKKKESKFRGRHQYTNIHVSHQNKYMFETFLNKSISIRRLETTTHGMLDNNFQDVYKTSRAVSIGKKMQKSTKERQCTYLEKGCHIC